jgi:hypothetical protein
VLFWCSCVLFVRRFIRAIPGKQLPVFKSVRDLEHGLALHNDIKSGMWA